MEISSENVNVSDIEKFYEIIKDTEELIPVEKIEEMVKTFIEGSLKKKKRIALVTSGGTTIPLERNTVRYLDNFSGGRRGASSAEYFLKNNYAVIFLHRKNSLQPYSRHFLIHQENKYLDLLELDKNDEVVVSPTYKDKIGDLVRNAKKVLADDSLLSIPFISLYEYLKYLKCICQLLKCCGRECLIYSSAAVSDFYLHPDNISEHKIQSKEGALVIQLEPVPKIIKIMKDTWCPESFIITFKLETDRSLLDKKAKYHLSKNHYGVQCVVGNILGEHQDKVTLYTEDGEILKFERTPEQKERDDDIEEPLVNEIINYHSKYVERKQ